MVKAKIAFLHGPHDLRIEEVNVPDPKPDQILIKLKAAGICGSDVECFEGHSKEGRYDIAPYTPGHEWAGQVAAIGNQVTGFKVGDKVTGDCCMNCFKCENCKRGLMPAACLNFREAGFRPDSPGGWGEYLLMEEHYVHKLPADWKYEEGALVEPFSVGHYGVWGPGGWVDASDDVVIFGGGMIGPCALLTCKAASANVMVVEPLANRRELAKTLGADVVIDPTQVKDLAAEVGKTRELAGARASWWRPRAMTGLSPPLSTWSAFSPACASSATPSAARFPSRLARPSGAGSACTGRAGPPTTCRAPSPSWIVCGRAWISTSSSRTRSPSRSSTTRWRPPSRRRPRR